MEVKEVRRNEKRKLILQIYNLILFIRNFLRNFIRRRFIKKGEIKGKINHSQMCKTNLLAA